jgi:hypothetical protein
VADTLRILVVGGSWHGGNCTGLVRAFRTLGHAVELVGIDRYLPGVDRRSIGQRVLSRAMTPTYARRFNGAVLRAADLLRPDFALVFKGQHVSPGTLLRLKEGGAWIANFYPDNSFLTHVGLDTGIFAHFDHIFTTKRFGIRDFRTHLGVETATFLPHGYDPHVHRPFTDPRLLAPMACDVSFIGTWSRDKERLLGALRRGTAPGQLRVWGGLWERCTTRDLDDAVMGYGITGDLYALGVSASTINLGLLSERRKGASDDDQITSRTFHIPACGGFLLHRRTDEVAEYFDEGKEIACFSTAEELVEKVGYYLAHEDERLAIARAGRDRCVAEDSLVQRARVILDTYREAR